MRFYHNWRKTHWKQRSTGERRARKLARGVRRRAGGKGRRKSYLACGLSYFVVLHPTEEGVRKAQVRAATWLADMGLEMKASKTRIAHTLHPINGQAGFDFLGFVRHASCTRGCCD